MLIDRWTITCTSPRSWWKMKGEEESTDCRWKTAWSWWYQSRESLTCHSNGVSSWIDSCWWNVVYGQGQGVKRLTQMNEMDIVNNYATERAVVTLKDSLKPTYTRFSRQTAFKTSNNLSLVHEIIADCWNLTRNVWNRLRTVGNWFSSLHNNRSYAGRLFAQNQS